MTKAELKSMIANMESRGVPDSAEIRVKRPDGTTVGLHGANYAIQGEDAEVTSVDGSWSGVAQENNAVFFKQN